LQQGTKKIGNVAYHVRNITETASLCSRKLDCQGFTTACETGRKY